MSDAAQKAVERALIDELGPTLGSLANDDEVEFGIAEAARHVLAVLSETHAVVELPEPDCGCGWYWCPDCDRKRRGACDSERVR